MIPRTFNRPLGPFAVLYEARAVIPTKPPQKTPRTNGSKALQSAISLMTPEERKARRVELKQARTVEILKINPYSDVGRNCPSQADRTNKITGKRITARHQ